MKTDQVRWNQLKWERLHNFHVQFLIGVNDIAVVKLVGPYVYNKYVQPLPVDYPPVVPEKGTR